jgi:hypothetical protein
MVQQGLPERHTFKTGDFVEELLVTDTRVYEVTYVSESGDSILINPAREGDRKWKDEKRTTPTGYGVVWHERLSSSNTLAERGLRRRLDGAFRTGRNTHPIRPCRTHEGVPVSETDYRF